MRRTPTLLLLIITATFFFAAWLTPSSAQRRAKTFQHSTRAHKEGKYKDCASCHTLPTKNWTAPRRDKLSPFPDVATYPYHNSCFGCHTKDIYTNGATFCGSCHVTASMRAQGGRGVLPFPLRSHSMQFKTIFPHDVHQDLIASNPTPARPYAPAHFIKASFTPVDDKKLPTFYSCAICHTSTEKLPKTVPRLLTTEKALAAAAADVFAKPLAPGFFKTSPSGHESCFSCHYGFKNLPVGKNNCAGCHEATQPYFEKNIIKRFSLKFDHLRVGHGEADCTTCHIRITQNSDVNAMKDADVPIITCRKCHAASDGEDEWKHIITIEIDKREASVTKKEAPFQCSYCHTSEIGRHEVPASHRRP